MEEVQIQEIYLLNYWQFFLSGITIYNLSEKMIPQFQINNIKYEELLILQTNHYPRTAVSRSTEVPFNIRSQMALPFGRNTNIIALLLSPDIQMSCYL